MSKQERRRLQLLHRDESLVVFKANEGIMAVILDADDYHRKMMQILDDNSFKKLKKDPTGRIQRGITRLLKATDWPEVLKKTLTPKDRAPMGSPKFIKSVAC